MDRERGDSRRDTDRNPSQTGSDTVSAETQTVWGDPEHVSSRALGADSAGHSDQLVNVWGRGPPIQTSGCVSAGWGDPGLGRPRAPPAGSAASLCSSPSPA